MSGETQKKMEKERERVRKWRTCVTGGVGIRGWWWGWEGVCLQPSTGGWITHTPNHASAETAKWNRVGDNET